MAGPGVWDIGTQFSEQYYTVFAKDPSRLHLMYREDSVWSDDERNEGREGGQGAVRGLEVGATRFQHPLQAIAARIAEMGHFQRTFVLESLDCVPTPDDSVLIQTCGTMGIQEGDSTMPSPFVESFYLRAQPGGYYVRSSSLHFIDTEKLIPPSPKVEKPEPEKNVVAPDPPKDKAPTPPPAQEDAPESPPQPQEAESSQRSWATIASSKQTKPPQPKPTVAAPSDPPPPSAKQQPNPGIYFHNVPSQASEEDIRKAFSPIGQIETLHYFREKRFGFINFVDHSIASALLADPARSQDVYIMNTRIHMEERRPKESAPGPRRTTGAPDRGRGRGRKSRGGGRTAV